MFKLKYKVMLLVLITSLLCVCAISSFSYIAAKRHVQEMRDVEYVGEVSRVKENIQNDLENFELELKFLVRLPSTQGAARTEGNKGYDSQKGVSSDQWLSHLRNALEQYALVHDRFVQVGLIDAAGKELVRVERIGNNVHVAALNELEDKSLHPYFKEALKRGADEAYLSPIGPDREISDTATAPEPVIRYTAPVFDSAKTLIGVLTIAFDARGTLHAQHMSMMSDHEMGSLFIADRTGGYLYHSQSPSKEWGSEKYLNTGEGLAKDYPEIASEILSGEKGFILSGKHEIFYSSFKISDQLTLIIGLDNLKRTIEAPLYQFRDFLIYVVLGVLGMTWFFSAIFVRRILESLNAITDATKRIAIGDFTTEITVKSNDEMADLAEGFNTMNHALKKKSARLTGLYELGIYKGNDSSDLADRIVSFIVSTTGSHAAIVERIDGDKGTIVSFYQNGAILRGGSFDLDGTVSAEVIKSRNACYCNTIIEEFPQDSFLIEHKIQTFIGVPILSAKREPLGVVAMMGEGTIKAREENAELLFTLSRIMAFEWELEIHLAQIKDLSLETIYRLSRAAEYRDEDTGLHLQRMSRYAAAVARKMGLGDETAELLLYAAPMHDVGKIGVPDNILLKAGKLEPHEWDVMKSHTELGGLILEGSQNPFIQLARIIAVTHHEKWDGTGYPKGLKGNDIPIEGRVTAIADVFDALTTRRPYKDAFPLEKALAIIRESSGSHFDPEVVNAFFSIQNEILSIKKGF